MDHSLYKVILDHLFDRGGEEFLAMMRSGVLSQLGLGKLNLTIQMKY